MLPLSSNHIPVLFKEAQSLEAAGRVQDARASMARVLSIDSRLPAAHFQHGRLSLRLGDVEGAVQSLERAVQLKPDAPAIWEVLARATVALGDAGRARSFAARVKSAPIPAKARIAIQDILRPVRRQTATGLGGAPEAKIREAIAALTGGDARTAERVATGLRREHPKVAIVADILACAQAALGKAEAAESTWRDAIALDPNYAESHANFGRFLVERGKLQDGISILERALKLAPGLTAAQLHLGVALNRAGGNTAKAVAALETVVRDQPNHAEALLELGRAYLSNQQPHQALSVLEKARNDKSRSRDVRICLAEAYAGLGRPDDALAEFDALLARDDRDDRVHSARATLLQTLGEFDSARQAFRKAVEIAPRTGEHYQVYLATEKLSADDPLIDDMQALFNDPDVPDPDRARLGFALAKTMEDIKAYHRVFPYLNTANGLIRESYPYDVSRWTRSVDALKSAFYSGDFRAIEGAGSFDPIFVTGLPRSGTTLVEQILASHSRVTGAGELGFARQEFGRAVKEDGASVLPWVDVPDDTLLAAAETVERKMRALHPDADRITDKGVQSYMFIGPIRAALPNARIVVVRRDPRDTLLSCYKNLFRPGTHLYSYDLVDLAEYYRQYGSLIEFWRRELPGSFYEIRYEDLIADPEAQIRALLDACDLEWEDACLSFHESKRRVSTLSVHQVRQPINAGSVAAWRRYETELAPLLDALGDLD